MPKVNEDYPGKKQPSAEELKARAIAQYTGEKTEKPKFPTEIVDLPSKGLLYPQDHPLSTGQIEMKYMTAKEEDILTTQSYIKQGVVLDKLFRALIISNGKGEKVNYNDILIGDKNALMIAARVLGYGKEYEVTITTPSGNKQKEVIDLTTIDDRPFDGSGLIEKHINAFEFKLPASKRIVKFKQLNQGDTVAIEKEIKGLKKIRKRTGGGDGELTTRLIHAIISLDGDEERATIRNFVNNEMLALDSKSLREHMKKVQPDVDLDIEFFDDMTGEPFEMSLPIDTNFFWPGA